MKEVIIGKNDAGQRLDKFLRKALPSLPAGVVYRGIRQKKIKCNGKRCDGAQRLNEGDVLTLYLQIEQQQPELAFLSAPAELDVVYEDAHLLLMNKPAGLVVHEDDSGSRDTLLYRMQHYLYDKGEYDPASEQSFAPALCNRIDRNTCGLVVGAKDAESLREITEAIRDRRVDKRYLCLVHGTPNPKEATLTHYWKKDEREKKVTIYPTPQKNGKTVKTAYRVLESRQNLSLVEVTLLTGRTHQIRAHMAYIGHPLFGDGKYGVNKKDREQGYKYQALCAYSVCFTFCEQSPLRYLSGRRFTIENIPFVEAFRALRLHG